MLPRGGGATWVTGSYDPELNLIYWGTGNPNPDYYGGDRMGDNLYTASLVALDADTGKLRWHYQFTPHDLHDWDSNHVPVLADLTIGGRARKVVMVANRNGFFYTLDRTNGELLVGKPYTTTKWAQEIGKDGKPIVLNDGVIPPGGSRSHHAVRARLPRRHGVQPAVLRSGAAAVLRDGARDVRLLHAAEAGGAAPGRGVHERRHAQAGRCPTTARCARSIRRPASIKWEYKFELSSLAGVMSTASGLVFAGNQEGYFNAFDGKTGKRLWSYRTGSPIWGAAASTYMLDGKQYVLIESGNTMVAFALPGALRMAACEHLSAFAGSRPRRRRAGRVAHAASSRRRRSRPPRRATRRRCRRCRRRLRDGGAEAARLGGGIGPRQPVEPGVPADRRDARHRAPRPAAHHPQRRAGSRRRSPACPRSTRRVLGGLLDVALHPRFARTAWSI